MSDVPVTMTLAMVEHGLREDVAGAITDSHAAAALRAALTMVRNVRAELEAGNGWKVDILTTARPLAARWPDAVRAFAPEAADRAAARYFEMTGGAHVERSYELLLDMAKICIEAVWTQPAPDRALLAELRRVSRLDAEARAAIAR